MNMKEKIEASIKYRDYLATHIQGVRDVYENIMVPVLTEEGLSEEKIQNIRTLLENHDASKYEDYEFIPYRNHFYDPEGHPKSHNPEYDYAWNHHQKTNPHHWQYWCLINDIDDPQVQPLDIPLQYIVEMLCDWQSAGAHYGNTAYEWYEKQKDKMKFSESTRALIEGYISYFK